VVLIIPISRSEKKEGLLFLGNSMDRLGIFPIVGADRNIGIRRQDQDKEEYENKRV
jgi:hypothetical protein